MSSMEKMKIVTTQSWKPVAVDLSLAEDQLEGFCGIEELSSYKLVQVGDKRKRGKTSRLDGDDSPNRDDYDERPSAARKCERVDDAPSTLAPCRKRRKKQNQPKPNSYDKFSAPVNDKKAIDMSLWRDLDVPEPVLKALADLGFTFPTAIQARVLPSAIRDRMDILGAAETGSGKTLAFGIPIVHHILSDAGVGNEKEGDGSRPPSGDDDGGAVTRPSLKALILTPTRELAIQVKNHLCAITNYTDIKVAVVVGGMAMEKQLRLLRRCPEIVVATPGRLWELIQQGNPYLGRVERIKYLVIDEADRMLEKGHFEEVSKLLARINDYEEQKKTRQTFVFSATLTMVHDVPKRVLTKRNKFRMTPRLKLDNFIAMIGMKERSKVIDVTRKFGTSETLTESRINCKITEKDYYLYYFVTMYPGRTLVFCNSIDCVRRLSNLSSLLKLSSYPLHASMHQKQRLKNLEIFSNGERSLLLATDVAARGLDIPNVEHVFHYQVPRTTEAYVHRSGRTARALQEGLSVMLIEPNEIVLYNKICKTLNRDVDLPVFPMDMSLLPLMKERVDLARQLDQSEHSLRKRKSQNDWFIKAAKDMDIELDEDELLNDLGDQEEQADYSKHIQSLRKQLGKLLSKPMIPRDRLAQYPFQRGGLLLGKQSAIPEKAINAVKKEKGLVSELMGSQIVSKAKRHRKKRLHTKKKAN